MGHKNDYSVIAFFQNEKPKKWTYVHKISGIVKYIDSTWPDWLYINVYNRRTRQFLRQFTKGSFVPDFL
jgi:hypothetical protein